MVKCTKRQIRELKTALRWKITAAQRQRIQMVLLRESEMTQLAIAAAMGVSLSTVNRAHMAYDEGGIKALKPKPIGGRQRENMTLSEEKALLARFGKAAGAGEMLNIHDLEAAYEQAIGHPTSNSTVYNLLARHVWRKLRRLLLTSAQRCSRSRRRNDDGGALHTPGPGSKCPTPNAPRLRGMPEDEREVGSSSALSRVRTRRM